jgi:predicted O-methyltransferase YrrM
VEAETLQVASELEVILGLYRYVQPQSVLEVGVWKGGTLQHWMRTAWEASIVAVDLTHSNEEAYVGWSLLGRSDLTPITGDSLAPEIVERVGRFAPFDWIFLDGDHAYESVRRDVDTYLPMLSRDGYLLLHDVYPPHGVGDYGPGLVLRELMLAGRHETLLVGAADLFNHEVSHGFGIVRPL